MMKNKLEYKNWMFTLRALLVGFLVLTFGGFFYASKLDSYDKQYITYAAELRVLIEQFNRSAIKAVIQADINSFKFLRYRTNEFTVILEILNRGKQNSAGRYLLPASPVSIRDKELSDLSRLWVVAKDNAETILNNQAFIVNAHENLSVLGSSFSAIRSNFLDIVDVLSRRNNIPGREYALLSNQMVLSEEIEQKVRDVLDVDIESSVIDRQFLEKMNVFENNLQILKSKYSNDAVYPKVLEVEKAFSNVKNNSGDVVVVGQVLDKVNSAWKNINTKFPNFLQATVALEKAYSNAPDNRWVNDASIIILSIITFVLTLLLLLFLNKENKKLQSEIKKLVHELKDFGSGNLAVQATGSGVTVAIADAINYSVHALRKLVSGINHTSKKVSSSASDAKRVAVELKTAINKQTHEIENVTETANAMSISINKVAESARKSASVAENSVTIAHEGAIVVNDTIAGMERIREQIQKTEKRIKRLGESSQEIGEIVSLIDGIAEQTNLLSLNASIQAAMAGDVGLGFAVVADEVQQLAVKSSQATKEVSNLVKAIQTDTNRAIESMEQAIVEVVSGTKLAHTAGEALGKIETVSKNLSGLIQSMSLSAEEQAIVASKISKMMEIIEAIAGQTAAGTETTSNSIAHLATLAEELRSSVSEFKLPETIYGK